MDRDLTGPSYLCRGQGRLGSEVQELRRGTERSVPLRGSALIPLVRKVAKTKGSRQAVPLAPLAHLSPRPSRPWSSARAHLTAEGDRTGIVDMRFWERAGGVDTWQAMHAAAEDVGSTQLLRRCTYAGRPFGPEDFLERLESKFARKWRRWGFEQPRSDTATA